MCLHVGTEGEVLLPLDLVFWEKLACFVSWGSVGIVFTRLQESNSLNCLRAQQPINLWLVLELLLSSLWEWGEECSLRGERKGYICNLLGRGITYTSRKHLELTVPDITRPWSRHKICIIYEWQDWRIWVDYWLHRESLKKKTQNIG